MKTAKELGLNTLQFNSLWATLSRLETGALRFVDYEKTSSSDGVIETLIEKGREITNFNMGVWCGFVAHSCGTVGCIGGTSTVLSGDPELWNDIENKAIDQLFYPDRKFLADISLEEAATQLRKYLETGTHDWYEEYKDRKQF